MGNEKTHATLLAKPTNSNYGNDEPNIGMGTLVERSVDERRIYTGKEERQLEIEIGDETRKTTSQQKRSTSNKATNNKCEIANSCQMTTTRSAFNNNNQTTP